MQTKELDLSGLLYGCVTGTGSLPPCQSLTKKKKTHLAVELFLHAKTFLPIRTMNVFVTGLLEMKLATVGQWQKKIKKGINFLFIPSLSFEETTNVFSKESVSQWRCDFFCSRVS